MRVNSTVDTRELRGLLTGLFKVQNRIYWVDFLVNHWLGCSAFFLSQWLDLGIRYKNPVFWFLFLTASFALYRAVIFTHEITHARRQLETFSVAWNILCGIPLAIPSFLYYQSHLTHHRASLYGTYQDGEYLPFASLSKWELVKYIVVSFFAQFLLILRFAVLTPIGLFVPKVRAWIIAHGSSLVIDPNFVGGPPSASEARDWAWQEPATAIFWLFVLTGMGLGWIPFEPMLWLFAMMGIIHVVNGLRTLAAHRFANPDGKAMTPEQQYLDSVNLIGTGWKAVLNVLTAPVGLRFHALHHLFPGLPYHSLPEAHKRISKHVPTQSNYFVASEPTLFSALFHLWKSATSHNKAPEVSVSVGEPSPVEN